VFDDVGLSLLQFKLLGEVRSDHDALRTTTSAGHFFWLQRMILPADR
jgi:hypothetical protein